MDTVIVKYSNENDSVISALSILIRGKNTKLTVSMHLLKLASKMMPTRSLPAFADYNMMASISNQC